MFRGGVIPKNHASPITDCRLYHSILRFNTPNYASALISDIFV